MKGTYIQPGDTLDYTNPTDEKIDAGTVIVFGTKAAIAAADIPAGETGAITLVGAWELSKDTSDITAGALVYYDAENDVATATDSVTEGEGQDAVTTYNAVLGTAIAAAGTTQATVIVRLNG